MGLNIYFVCKCCKHYIDVDNITHNVAAMAGEAGLYDVMWRPEENGIETTDQMLPLLEAGLARLLADPAKFEAMNPANGWGSYKGLVETVRKVIERCKEHPGMSVEVSR